MSKSLDKHIEEHNEALKRFNALTGEEKKKEEEYQRKLEDRMQSEHNVTFLNDDAQD